ncbi:mitochondrial coenzyme A diphosphatase NUDT8-like isoform X2 [Symsagittifera roscoffensis]|uniref:mitochondrial coenzyme A diphosphatase NUDT8-like isoform X2 n=1 Tax=Symsagittifera roscoffensis TaxID=84072 RepID=UPI00307C30C9
MMRKLHRSAALSHVERIVKKQQLEFSRCLSTESVALDEVFSSQNRLRVTNLLQDRLVTIREQKKKKKKKKLDDVSLRTRVSAVLVPFCSVEDQPALLFTRRSSKLISHRGEISFPGGIADDADDGDLVQTAVRETCEELGVRDKHIDVWGEFCLPPNAPLGRGKYLATPVIAHMGDSESLLKDMRPNADEVEKVHFALKDLCDLNQQNYTVHKAWRQNPLFDKYYSPLFTPRTLPLDNQNSQSENSIHIFGLTALIVCVTLPLLYPRFKHKVQLIEDKKAFSFI